LCHGFEMKYAYTFYYINCVLFLAVLWISPFMNFLTMIFIKPAFIGSHFMTFPFFYFLWDLYFLWISHFMTLFNIVFIKLAFWLPHFMSFPFLFFCVIFSWITHVWPFWFYYKVIVEVRFRLFFLIFYWPFWFKYNVIIEDRFRLFFISF